VLNFKLYTKWLYGLRNIERKVTKGRFLISHRTEIGNTIEYVKKNIDTEEKRNLVSGGGWTQSRTQYLCKNDTTSFAQRASETARV